MEKGVPAIEKGKTLGLELVAPEPATVPPGTDPSGR